MTAMRWLGVLCPMLVVVWAACGGDVVVDGRPGTAAGGAGGTGNASVGAVTPDTAVVNASAGPASVGPGVTTGPGDCDCLQACNKLVGCGYDVGDCDIFCDGIGPGQRELFDCICAAPACDVERCVGGPPNTCIGCLSELGDACGAQVETCFAVPTCTTLVDCHFACGFEPQCVQGCDQKNPEAVPSAYGLLECLICDHCFEPCADEGGNTYCFLR
jgi:hypothetical protein